MKKKSTSWTLKRYAAENRKMNARQKKENEYLEKQMIQVLELLGQFLEKMDNCSKQMLNLSDKEETALNNILEKVEQGNKVTLSVGAAISEGKKELELTVKDIHLKQEKENREYWKRFSDITDTEKEKLTEISRKLDEDMAELEVSVKEKIEMCCKEILSMEEKSQNCLDVIAEKIEVGNKISLSVGATVSESKSGSEERDLYLMELLKILLANELVDKL